MKTQPVVSTTDIAISVLWKDVAEATRAPWPHATFLQINSIIFQASRNDLSSDVRGSILTDSTDILIRFIRVFKSIWQCRFIDPHV